MASAGMGGNAGAHDVDSQHQHNRPVRNSEAILIWNARDNYRTYV